MSANMREPHGPSMASMCVGIGRGKSIDGSSVVSSSATRMCAGRGAPLQDDEQRQMANAQKPYEQYLVSTCSLFVHVTFNI